MNHIVLIGFMGAGKTTIGKRLSEKLGIPFADTDERIEQQTGRKISEIFAEEGEAYFRELETKMLHQLIQEQTSCVIAVGGGLPMQAVNRPLLRELGTVVFLEAEIDSLVKRLQGDVSRPKLQGGDLRERIETLMRERLAVYQEVADVRISTDTQDMEEILLELQKCAEAVLE